MRRCYFAIVTDRSGSTAVEFALLLPILLMLLLGMIDAGRFMWAANTAEKATQAGARFAIATNVIPAGLANYSFSVDGSIPQGNPIPESAFAGASCISSASPATSASITCSCVTGGTCPALGTPDQVAFNNIVDRMKMFKPDLEANQIKIDYAFSGLGYAGDPNGIDVSPLVKVSLRQDANRPVFQAMTAIFFGRTIGLPPFSAELTLEDGVGTVSN